MTSSPTQRTLARCRKNGWIAQVVEKWNSFTNTRHDLFGCVDVVALDGEPGILGIQTTSTGNMSKRVAKCLEVIPREWLRAGNRLQVWGWSQRVHYLKSGKKAKRKRWTVKVTSVKLKSGG